MRNNAAATEAKAVLTGDGRVDRKGLEERRARMPELAAVSPKRAETRWEYVSRLCWHRQLR